MNCGLRIADCGLKRKKSRLFESDGPHRIFNSQLAIRNPQSDLKARFMPRLLLVLTVVSFAAAALAEPQPSPLPEPAAPEVYLPSNHSNDRTVQLLVQMLEKPEFAEDPLLRERIVIDLGRACNYHAAAAIARCARDRSRIVRAAAAQAMGLVPLYWVEAPLKNAIGDPDLRVARQAALSAARLHFDGASPQVASLISRGDPELTAAAVDALIVFKKPLEEEELVGLLANPSVKVRLAALRMADIAPKDYSQANQALLKMAASGDPSVRAKALPVVANRVGAAAVPKLRQAAKDGDWRICAAAIEGLGTIGPDQAIIAALSDSKEPVRLAACRACARTKDPAAFEALWHTMLDDPWQVRMDAATQDVRKAAREALCVNDNPEVAQRACAMILENLPALLDLKGPRRVPPAAIGPALYPSGQILAHRDRVLCAGFILARTGRIPKEVRELALTSLRQHADCDVAQSEIAAMAAVLDGPAAVEALEDYLTFARDTAQEHYATRHSREGPTVSFCEQAYISALNSLFKLDSQGAVAFIDRTVDFFFGGDRFDLANDAVIDLLEKSWDTLPSEHIDVWLSQFLSDPTFNDRVRWEAAHLAGVHKFSGAKTRGALAAVIEKERPSRELIYVCGWATQQITGTAPQTHRARDARCAGYDYQGPGGGKLGLGLEAGCRGCGVCTDRGHREQVCGDMVSAVACRLYLQKESRQCHGWRRLGCPSGKSLFFWPRPSRPMCGNYADASRSVPRRHTSGLADSRKAAWTPCRTSPAGLGAVPIRRRLNLSGEWWNCASSIRPGVAARSGPA